METSCLVRIRKRLLRWKCWKQSELILRDESREVESACGYETTFGKRCVGSAERAHCRVQSLSALAGLLSRGRREKTTRLYGLGVLGQTRAGIWRCAGASDDSWPGSGSAWIEPDRSAFYR